MNRPKKEQIPWNILDVGSGVIALILLAFLIFLVNLPALDEGLGREIHQLLVAVSMLILFGVLFLISWLLTVKKYKTSFESLGFVPFDLWDGTRAALFWLVVILVFVVPYAILVPTFSGFSPPPDLIEKFGATYFGMALAIFATIFAAPVAEETFFRGFIYPAIKKKVGMVGAIVISALMFAVLHLGFWQFIPIFVIGAVLAYLYEKEKSLGPPIILHSLYNVVNLLLFYLSRR